ncbi:MAG TPA: ankyrin repeat domain-containing protein [Candidatus Limnocylindrales bacterium]|nr:ankyrin repeat domain-containing protein [Candidatus Limnocylindrales bacterium]
MALVASLAVLALVLGACSPAAPVPDAATGPSVPSARGAPVTDLRLHDAATRGDLAGIASLLGEGLPIDGRDATGRTPVLAATHARQTAAVAALIDAGADLDLQDDRLDNVFLYAGAEGLLDILRLANEAGADPAITNRFGGVAVIPASERGHVEVVRYLLDESDVDVDHVNRLGWTALLEAIILSDGGPAHQEIVGMLLAAGADPELDDNEGVTPLAHARSRGYAEIERLLLDAGATR